MHEWDGGLLRRIAPELAARVVFLEECGSTNDEAKELAARGARAGTVVLTERQSAGRGRRGGWSCPAGEGIACSVILRPEEPVAQWSRHALAAGVGVAEGLEGLGVQAGLKWPNDVWLSGRKLCGILVEATAGVVVVGLGINVNVRSFPEELAFPATSLLLEKGQKVSREAVLAAVIPRVIQRCGEIGEGFGQVCQAWEEWSVLRGREVSLRSEGQSWRGTVVGLGKEGELRLEGAWGHRGFLNAEEVRLIEA